VRLNTNMLLRTSN